jgi:diketogulonate reductase-like aldo/keto reductase
MVVLDLLFGLVIIGLLIWIFRIGKEKEDSNNKIINDAIDEINTSVDEMQSIVDTLLIYVKDEDVKRGIDGKLKTLKESIRHGVVRLIGVKSK